MEISHSAYIYIHTLYIVLYYIYKYYYRIYDATIADIRFYCDLTPKFWWTPNVLRQFWGPWDRRILRSCVRATKKNQLPIPSGLDFAHIHIINIYTYIYVYIYIFYSSEEPPESPEVIPGWKVRPKVGGPWGTPWSEHPPLVEVMKIMKASSGSGWLWPGLPKISGWWRLPTCLMVINGG